MSLLGVLLLIFVVLKFFGLITWSWLWVLSPLWIGPAVIAIGAFIAFALSLISGP
jgi:hypothetical protein